MTELQAIADSQGRKNHWLVGGKLIAGPETAKAALAAMENMDNESEPPMTWDNIRWERNKHLAASDWTQLGDSPLASNQAWLDYRQALRDIPSDFDTPEDVAWPVAP